MRTSIAAAAAGASHTAIDASSGSAPFAPTAVGSSPKAIDPALVHDPRPSARETLDPTIVNCKALVVLGYVTLYVVLYVTSGLAISLVGHWFFLLRLTALWFMGIVLFAAVSSAVTVRAAPVVRTLYACAFAVLLLSGVLDLFAIVGEGRPAEIASNARAVGTTKGYNYSEYLDKFVYHIDFTEEQKIGILLRYRDEPELLWPSITHSLFEHSMLPLEEVLAICRRAYGERWITSLKGLGPYLRNQNGNSLDAEFAAIALAPAETQEALAEAIGRTGKGLKITPDRIEEEIRAPVPPQWRQAFLRGTGWRIHQLNRMHPERALEFISHESSDAQVPLREGLEAAVAMNTLK